MKKLLMLQRYLYLFVFTGILLSACTQDEELFSNENVVIEKPTLRAIIDPTYKELGWGIDMTGDYLTLDAAKAPVIDVKKFEAAFKSRIISKQEQRYAYTNTYYGNTSEEYVKSMDVKLSGDFGNMTGKEGELKFPHTISSNYSKKSSYSSNYTFVGQDECVEIGKAYFVENDVTVLRNYLDAGFLYSVNKNSAETVVSEYGTHVLLDITLGGKLSFLYRSEVITTSKETTAKAGFAVNVLKKFGITGEGSTNTSLVTNNKNAYVHTKSSGGKKSISLSHDFNNGGLPIYSTLEWSGSIDFNNSVTLKVLKAIPIYELIADPTKKRSIKEAVDKYIKARQLELISPLYRYYHSKKYDHFYTQSNSPTIDGWSNEGIACYVLNKQIPGSLPFYEFWDEKNWDHLYSTWNGTPPTIHSNTWKLSPYVPGYVFDKQVVGTVPLYGFWNVKSWDHLYTLERYPAELSYGWIYEKVACWVYPNNY